MKFGNQLLEEIKIRLKVSDIVAKKVKLKPRGKEFIGLSPFSSEKTPSFTVSDDKGFYHCFSSGEHGSIFDFVMKTENLNFKEAVKKLAGYAGINIDENSYTKEDNHLKNKIKILKEILKETTKWYQENLLRELKTNSFLKNIFIKRNFNRKIIETFGLGYAPPNNNETYNFLSSKNYTTQDILDAGLLIVSEKNKKYDRFKNRIIFPIYDYFSNVVGFGGRAVNQNQLVKYINSPSTLLYKKGDLLYGWKQYLDNTTKKNYLFIVEGYTDVISMYNVGLENTMAPLGTALTEKQIIKSWQIAKEPIICLDGDSAGKKAAQRISELVLPHLKPNHSLSFVQLPKDEDPDSLVLSKKLDELKSCLKQKVPLLDFIWNNMVFGKSFDTPEKKAGLEEEISRLVNLINDNKIRKNYYNSLRQKFFEEFRLSFKKQIEIKKQKSLENKEIIDSNKITERILLGSVILFPNLLNSIGKKFNSINFESRNFNNIKKLVLDLCNSKKTIENLNLRTKLLSSGYHKIINKIIDKTIYIHAPFLKNKKENYIKILNGWNEYWDIYAKKIGYNELQKKASVLLNDLNEKNYYEFKNLQISEKKNLF